MRISTSGFLRVAALWGALSMSCGGPSGPELGYLEPDFSLLDANPNSATSGLMVSPRQHVARISAWYFGHST